jgi:hypothetical protein
MGFNDLPLFRNTDPDTSRAGAEHVKPRQGSQMMRLLAVYARYPKSGLTDERASHFASLPHGWKRCADLRRNGFIVDTGQRLETSNGAMAMVCVITPEGLELVK